MRSEDFPFREERAEQARRLNEELFTGVFIMWGSYKVFFFLKNIFCFQQIYLQFSINELN
jgi:hypothetical protein